MSQMNMLILLIQSSRLPYRCMKHIPSAYLYSIAHELLYLVLEVSLQTLVLYLLHSTKKTVLYPPPGKINAQVEYEVLLTTNPS